MKKSFTNILCMISIAMAFDWLGKAFPDAVYSLFAYPAAFLASLFLGSHPVLIDKQEILIPLFHHPIHVIPACSAYGFFCLLLAMMVTYSFRLQTRSRILLYSILAGPVAYVLTVMINGCRIICAYQVHEVTRFLLPSNFHAAIHQGVGIVLFLTTLMGVSLLWERKFCYDGPRQ